MEIHMNITFPRLPCELLTLDVMDVSGEQQHGVLTGVRKARLEPADKGGKVIGGETTYPDALPGRAIRIDVEYLRTVDDQKPATCKAYLNYPA